MVDGVVADSPRRGWLGRVLRVSAALVAVLGAAVALILVWLATRYEAADFDEDAARGITHTPLRCVVPGPGLPDGLSVMKSNNNLDVVCHDGVYYFAFRTAPTHFASKKTRLVILRSDDRSRWELDGELQIQERDLREPRFLSYKGKLFLYLFLGGSNPLAFEPQQIHASERGADGTWTEPKPVFEPGYVVWRARVFGDTAYMSVYNGAGIYTTDARPGEVRLLRSTDGYAWEPISEEPQVTDIGAEEGEFAFDEEGNLVATIRLEVQGAKVCVASKDDLAHWHCRFTPEKYDSAYMFRHGDDFYVIARRNVAGAFNRNTSFLSPSLQRAWYLARYSLTRKRTALYKVDVENLRLAPLFDFPSKGDTAYAGAVQLDEDSYYVLNYSSPVRGPDWPWLAGQVVGTNIYETVLCFDEDEASPRTP